MGAPLDAVPRAGCRGVRSYASVMSDRFDAIASYLRRLCVAGSTDEKRLENLKTEHGWGPAHASTFEQASNTLREGMASKFAAFTDEEWAQVASVFADESARRAE